MHTVCKNQSFSSLEQCECMLRTSQGGRMGTSSLPVNKCFWQKSRCCKYSSFSRHFTPVQLHFLQWSHILCTHSSIHPFAVLFVWGSQWCGLKATMVGLLCWGTLRTAKMKTKPPDRPASPNQRTVLPLYPSPTSAHPKTLETNPPSKRKLLPCIQTLFIHSFRGWILGELVGAGNVHGSCNLWWEPGTERGCAYTPCYSPTNLWWGTTRDSSHPVGG